MKINELFLKPIYEKIKDVYSTEEVKTNKIWIDGKPIYRKVIVSKVTEDNGSIPTGISNIENITNLFGMLNKSGEDIIPISFYTASENRFSCFYRTSTNSIQTRGANVGTNSTGYFILEYTKTTD